MAVTGAEALRLVEATDADFAWMLGETSSPNGLRLADGILDRDILIKTRANAARLRAHGCGGSWLMVVDSEVAGLCGYRGPPDAEGVIEIGYSVAEPRRGRGYATRAVALVVERAVAAPNVRRLRAGTAPHNIASHRVLERNGFEIVGRYADPKYGQSILWQREV